jgi:hypothetical protein
MAQSHIMNPAPRLSTLLDSARWWEPVWLLCLAPMVLLPERLLPGAWHAWLVLAMMLFWPLHLLRQHRLTTVTSVAWPLVLILLWLPITLWDSINRAHSWQVAGYILLGISLCCSSKLAANPTTASLDRLVSHRVCLSAFCRRPTRADRGWSCLPNFDTAATGTLSAHPTPD